MKAAQQMSIRWSIKTNASAETEHVIKVFEKVTEKHNGTPN